MFPRRMVRCPAAAALHSSSGLGLGCSRRRPMTRGDVFLAAAVLLLTVGAMGFASPLAAETMGTLSLDEGLVVRGLTLLDSEALARSLVYDDDLLLISRPVASRKLFLAAVAHKATLALQREGYAAARATAGVDRSNAGEHVVVDVVEGPRQMAAGIEITGLPEDLAESLHRWLQSQRPPPGAVPQAFDTPGGWSGVRWLDLRGLPAKMEQPVWTPGTPAPFDLHHLRTVRTAIGRFLRDNGYFAAAKLVDADKPTGLLAGLSTTLRGAGEETATTASFDVSVRAGMEGAVLAISVVGLQPASVLRGIDVPPGARTTSAELQKAIGIVPGGRVTDQDRLAWREALRLSGRFVRHEVKFKEIAASADAGGVPGILAVFDIEEYPRATPLAEPLTREEQTMLTVRDWLLKTLADDNDLIVTWALTPAAVPAAPAQPVGSLIVSTHQGILLSAMPASPEACGVAVSGDGLGWFLPRAAGWFEIAIPTRQRLSVDIAVFLTETIVEGHHTYRHTFSVSSSMERRPRDATAALAMTARIEPVACLAMVHEGNPVLSWEGDDLVVTRSDMTARLDSRTGRPISMTLTQGGGFLIDAAPGRLAEDLTELREAAGDDLTRDDALVSSGIEFFASQAMGAAFSRLFEAVGLSETMAAWEERLGVVGEKLRCTARSGGFAAADRALAAAVVAAREEASASTLTIPSEGKGPPESDSRSVLIRTATAAAWRWTEHTCGRDAWPAALARVAALASIRDPVTILEIAAYMSGKRNGPVACLAAASAVPMPSMAAALARHGQETLTVEAFHADCQPLLSLMASCGIDCGAVSLLRTIDDDEAMLLGQTLLQDPEIFLPLVHDLRNRESDATATAALPEVLDRWWEASLRKTVTADLAARVAPLTADKPATQTQPVR